MSESLSLVRQRLSFKQQLQVIDIYHKYKGLGSATILVHLRSAGFVTISMPTVRRYVRDEASIQQYVSENPTLADRTRHVTVALPDLEKALWVWIQDAERRGLHMTGHLLREKARRLAIEMGVPPSEMIEFSDGWLTRFKNRYGIKERTFHGEAASAPIELIEPAQKELQEVISQFPKACVINMDETALLSCQTSNKGLASQSLSGHKVDKTRLTVVLATSAAGGKLPPFVIGHARRPRAFTHGTPAEYNFWYAHNTNAWMTRDLFNHYVTTLDKWARNAGNRILLICDNASSHKNVQDLTNVTIKYLPPNLTSHIQPMDAGIIRNFKANYNRHLDARALDLDALGSPNPYKVNQLQAMRMITQAWNEVSAATIQNCWRHTGILPPGDAVRDVQDMLVHARL